MVKEVIICIVIIVSIFSLDMYTQNFTKETVSQITDGLTKIENNIKNRELEQANIKIEEVNREWENKHDKLAYYIEHDELEKVDASIIKMRSYYETEEFSEAIAELEEGRFVLEHIQEKNAFNLENIF